jgi:hypothetical protein
MPAIAAPIVPAATSMTAQQAGPEPAGRMNTIQIVVSPADHAGRPSRACYSLATRRWKFPPDALAV